jgi:hypothetical protein
MFTRIEVIAGFEMGFAEADRMLHFYRTTFSPFFPFVPVPPTITAYDLFLKQPFLFRCVVHAVAPQSPAIQRSMNQWFREFIARHIVVQQERRLELLQGMLVFLGW